MAMDLIEQWVHEVLWTRWGWKGWMEDDCDLPYRDIGEKRRIQSAVEFVLRALGNNESPGTQMVVDSILERRRKLSSGQDRDKESERTRDLNSGPLAGDRK